MKKLLLSAVFIIIIQTTLSAQITVVQQIIDSVSPDSLIYFVNELSGVVNTSVNGSPATIVSRNKYNPSNELAKDYIRQKLESYEINTTLQSFSSTGNNVIGTQNGTKFPGQKFIICAHYDDMPAGAAAPGADDNASGTAAVIEAARILSEYSFPFTVIYALWDEEEQGLVGSNYYAMHAQSENDSILGVINLDMIAWDSNDNGIINVHTDDVGITLEMFNKMLEINSLYDINLTIAEVYPAAPYSDHKSFLNYGFAALLIIEDDNDFNQYYHTINDLIKFLNHSYFHRISKLAIGTLATYAFNYNLNIIHTPVASIEVPQDIVTTAQIVSGLEIGTAVSAPRLYYRTDYGSGFGNFQEAAGTTHIGENIYTFTIPALPVGSKVQYYIAVQDVNSVVISTLPAGGKGFNPPGNIPPDEFFQFYVGPVTYIYTNNADNLKGWTKTGTWGITESDYTSPPSSFTDSPSGNYPANSTSDLTLNKIIDLTNVLGAYLEFETRWSIENNWDYGMIQISTDNGLSWNALKGKYTNPGSGSHQPTGQPLYDGVQNTWVHEIIDLSDYTGQTVKLRFYLKSDGYLELDGWYIDDIVLSMFNMLPVELASFSAEVIDNNIILNWITSTETNNYGFEIERRREHETEWKTAGFVKGSGTSATMKNYSFEDLKSGFGTIWYRLKQIDYGGKVEYFGPIKAENKITSFALYQNYPNPFNPGTTIRYAVAEKQDIILKVYDILGNEVSTLVNEEKQPGIYDVEFSTENSINNSLASGVYIYRLYAGESVFTKKMILLR